MPVGTWAEEMNRLQREADEIYKRARTSPMSAWARRIAARDPEQKIVREAIRVAEFFIDQGRMQLGYTVLFARTMRRRGRKAAAHPLPRRDPKSLSDYRHRENHVRDHRDAYIYGCQRCYVREYLYYRNHPEERPKGVWTAGLDEQGRDPKARVYHPGWDPEKFPFKA